MDDQKLKRWALAEIIAGKIAEKKQGARIVPRKNDEKLDVRFDEGGIPIRVVFDVCFDDLEISARAKGVSGTFSLFNDPETALEDNPEVTDEWDEVDHTVFYGPSIFICGSSKEISQESAFLQNLPASLLGELLELMKSSRIKSVILENEIIEASLDLILSAAADGQKAIEIAKVIGQIAASLPHEMVLVGESQKPMRCAYCNSLFYPRPERTQCANCGASY